MRINDCLVRFLFVIRSCLNRIINAGPGVKTPEIRVLLFHNIPQKFFKPLDKTLKDLKKNWTFLTPSQFESIMNGNEELTANALLLTFDDGFKSNWDFAKSVLKKNDIKAIFFIPTAFITLDEPMLQIEYVRKNIKNIVPQNAASDNWQSMTWKHIKDLVDWGHTIGGHTKDHKRLSDCTHYELAEEISLSADFIEKKIGVEVRHFAYPFGSMESFSEQAMKTAWERFDFIYTGMRGGNVFGTPNWAVRRDTLSPNYSTFLMKSFLSGSVDWHYTRRLKKFAEFLRFD